MAQSTWEMMTPAQQAQCADAGRGPFAFQGLAKPANKPDESGVEKEDQDVNADGVENEDDDDLEDFIDEDDEDIDVIVDEDEDDGN